MSEERFLEMAAKIMSDNSPLPVMISIKEAWLLVSCLQLGTRHPHISPTQTSMFEQVGKQFQAAIVERHPEVSALINMGWDERFDVDVNPPSPDFNSPEPLKSVNNCWTIYTSEKEDESSLAQIGRPQDWGDPRWMYRVYTLEAQGYRNTVHCWVDQQMKDHEHLQLFAQLVATIMLPGWPVERSGRDYMAEDDFWQEAWGEMPPYADEDEDDYL
jgi:hypothetical protein